MQSFKTQVTGRDVSCEEKQKGAAYKPDKRRNAPKQGKKQGRQKYGEAKKA